MDGEPVQRVYEELREEALSGRDQSHSAVAVRFDRMGLPGLIAQSSVRREAEIDGNPLFFADLVGAARPRWSPHEDPRLEAMVKAYLSLICLGAGTKSKEEGR